ncbi:MAG TPA: glycosyltransferase family A protein [Candidatus Babeliales bacterium]|nr:glycosyltransferase family A protein [Candidatus Babeliales bacterium]
MYKIYSLILPILFILGCGKKHPFVVVIPSYNNINYYKKNLISVKRQRYKNYRIIYIDDNSSDNTGNAVEQYINVNKFSNITFIKNKTRVGALANQYRALQLCKDNEIIIHLDGDDWFAHPYVLSRINHEYRNKDVWLTYGQFRNWPTRKPGWCKFIQAGIIKKNRFREFGFCSAQPRTFYAWLARKIDVHDLMDKDGKFYQVAGDTALMFPMLEMAGDHFSFIKDVIYIRNVETPINDFKVNKKEQERVTLEIRRKKKYKKIGGP